MNEILCGLAIFAIIAILLVAMEFYSSSVKIFPKGKIAGNVWTTYSHMREFVLQNKKINYTRVALVFGVLLAACLILSIALSFLAPYILLLAFLILIFFPSKTSESEVESQSKWLAPPIDVIRSTMFAVSRKLAAFSASHMHSPLTEFDLQIQSGVFHGIPAFQICCDKEDSPEDIQENHIMLSRINTQIRQLLQSEQMAGIVYPLQGDLIACVSVRNMGIYWEFYIIYTPEGFVAFYPKKKVPPTSSAEKPIPNIVLEKMTGIPICWDGELLKEGMKLPVLWQYTQSPSLLLIGNTGTGKTNAAKIVLFESSKITHSQITVCDYKAEDFAFLTGSTRYYSFNACIDGLNSYYADFEARQKGLDVSRTFKLLAFDEWASFLNMLDKKEAETAKMKLATLLMLGRSFNIHTMIIQQRADASYFAAGARDQFSLICSLGNISKESAAMFGFDKEHMEPVMNPGEGHMLSNGTNQKRIVFPLLKDSMENHQIICEALTR